MNRLQTIVNNPDKTLWMAIDTSETETRFEIGGTDDPSPWAEITIPNEQLRALAEAIAQLAEQKRP